jgi:predicted ATPase
VKITKIALTGAHGVGKTTLASELLVRLAGKGFGTICVAPEVPREICSLAADPEFYRRGKNNPLKQALLMYGQLQYEHFSLPQADGVLICDRSVLDLWAYSKYLFGDKFRAGGVLELYETLFAQYCRSY